MSGHFNWRFGNEAYPIQVHSTTDDTGVEIKSLVCGFLCAETNEKFFKNITGYETLVMAVKLGNSCYNEYLFLATPNQACQSKTKVMVIDDCFLWISEYSTLLVCSTTVKYIYMCYKVCVVNGHICASLVSDRFTVEKAPDLSHTCAEFSVEQFH
jgi:hypothetical protein